MASSVKTRSPSSAVTGPRRAALTGYRWLLLAFLLLGGVQIFLAGLGAFRLGHPDASADVAFAPHRTLGFAMGGVALVIFILALISRPGVRAIVASAVLFLLAVLAQSLLASLADNTVLGYLVNRSGHNIWRWAGSPTSACCIPITSAPLT